MILYLVLEDSKTPGKYKSISTGVYYIMGNDPIMFQLLVFEKIQFFLKKPCN